MYKRVTDTAKPRLNDGFTLIELSLVLIIIGLIVGGVLVGQDLIRASEIRAQITQIEKYNSAVNTFRNKYNAMPGDMNGITAAQFGFAAHGPVPGQGDGNGVIEGSDNNLAEGFEQDGEVLSFWVDLTVGNPGAPISINLIDISGSAFGYPGAARVTITAANAQSYFPAAKIGRGNSVYVYSSNGVNYFGIAPMTATTSYPDALKATMTVQQAYQIDKKIDDGFPAAGNVTATWDSGSSTANTPAENAVPPTVNAQATDSATSCYNNSTPPGAYSTNQSTGANANCALSFRFQ